MGAISTQPDDEQSFIEDFGGEVWFKFADSSLGEEVIVHLDLCPYINDFTAPRIDRDEFVVTALVMVNLAIDYDAHSEYNLLINVLSSRD